MLREKISIELKNIKLWLALNDMKINVKKSSYILLQNKPGKSELPPVYLDNEIVRRVQSMHFLGVIIDENINWKSHINELRTKLYKLTGLMYRIRHNLTIEAKMSIYYTLF